MTSTLSRRNFLSAAGMATAAALLQGCGDAGGDATTGSGGAIRFTDLSGRTLSLAAPASRVVAMAAPYAAMALAVHGSPSRLAGMHPRARDMFEEGIVANLFPEVLDIPTDIVVGGDFTPNVEGLARLAPDMVIQWADLGEAIIAPIENAGLPVARFRTLPQGPEATLAAMLNMLGAMAGVPERATALNDVVRQTDDRLRSALAAIPAAQAPRVLLIGLAGAALYASGGGRDSLYSYYIYRAGGENVAERLPDLSPIGTEQIAAWDSDVIFLFRSEGQSPARLFADPVLGSLRAARTRRIYVLPTGTHYWGSVGAEDALTKLWMAELLHPDAMPRLLRSEMETTYRAILGRDVSNALIDDVLSFDVNAASGAYDRFVASAG